MNKLLILVIMVCLSIVGKAQSNNTVSISLVADNCTNIVQLYKIEQGGKRLIDECDLSKTTKKTFVDTCDRAFYLVKNGKNFTKIYAIKDRVVNLNIKSDTIEIIKPSKENKVLIAWDKLSHRARTLSVKYADKYKADLVKQTPFYNAMRELEKQQQPFLKKIKSSDEYFCRAIEVLVDAEINYFKLFNPQIPVIKASIKELPEDLYGTIITPKRISKPIILDIFESTIEYVHLYGAFNQKKDRLKGKPVVEYVDATEVKVAYLLKFARFYKDGRGLKIIETKYQELFTEGYALEQLDALKEEFKIRAENAKLSKIELKTPTGDIVKLSDYRGKIVVVDVWATWCAPCMKKRPNFEKLAHEMSNENVVFVAISIDDSEIKWKKIAEQSTGIELLDYKRSFSTAYGISSIPHFLVFDQEGMLFDSPAPSPGAGLKEKIQEALSKMK